MSATSARSGLPGRMRYMRRGVCGGARQGVCVCGSSSWVLVRAVQAGLAARAQQAQQAQAAQAPGS
jgi:hypothetical protein